MYNPLKEIEKLQIESDNIKTLLLQTEINPLIRKLKEYNFNLWELNKILELRSKTLNKRGKQDTFLDVFWPIAF